VIQDKLVIVVRDSAITGSTLYEFPYSKLAFQLCYWNEQ